MAHADKVLAAALDLPEGDRARVAHELLRSLDPENDDARAAWTAELARRLQDVREGRAALDDLDQVDAYVEERLAAVRK